MKVAVVSDNGVTISRHFGRAGGYLVFTIEESKIVGREWREKTGHQQFSHEDHDHQHHTHEHGQGMDSRSVSKHTQMIEPIRDCEAVVARGMGTGAYLAMEQAKIRPLITDIADAEEAVCAYIDGNLVDHPEWLH
jgi:predicted Fe-Mo cluster-binding NifX family protein